MPCRFVRQWPMSEGADLDRGSREADGASLRPILRVEGIALAPQCKPVDAELFRGEILGLAGLEGHGQELFLKTLCGLSRPVSGKVSVMGAEGNKPVGKFSRASRNGIAYVPRDRKAEGIFGGLSVLDNFSMMTLGKLSVAGILRRKTQLGLYAEAQKDLKIVSEAPSQAISGLSGGNQQKVLLARALQTGARILLLNDPSRGVDIGTKRNFHETFRRLARDQGVAIVLLSTELNELVEVCDRVLVFHAGTLFAEYSQPLSGDSLLAAMFGRRPERPHPGTTEGVGLGHMDSRRGSTT